MVDLKSLTFEELSLLCRENDLPAFRAKQIFKWISRGVTSFEEMTDLPLALREQFSQKTYLSEFKIAKKLVSRLDGTTKYLVKLQDGQHIECVLMKYRHGYSLCMSTQVGCAMGCSFCASTKGGLKRNLTAGELLDQYTLISKDIGERISTVVLMGIGEPLHNFKNLCVFLKNINDERGVNLSHRHITLSTCGLCDRIDELAQMGLQINLAISLHAATDKQRQEIMPIAKRYSLDELIKSCINYEEKTGRRITFEYTLIGGVNDSQRDIDNLSRLLQPLKNKHVNIISVNPIEGSSFTRLQDRAVERFAKSLEAKNINATVRRSMGSDISGSCGQLRYSEEKGGNSL